MYRVFKLTARCGASIVTLVMVVACVTEEPSTSPLDLRSNSHEEGRVSGQVRASTGGESATYPVPKAVVELGNWRGGPYEFRNSHGEGVADTQEDARFRVIARVVVDDTGAYHFREVPRGQIFGLRARPPVGTPYRLTYLDSLFSLGQGRDRWKWFRIVLQPMSSGP